MYFSTWETYHTHTLFLGYFNGPTEGLILACTFMSMSGYFGPAIWQAPLSSYISLPVSLQSSVGSITFLAFLPWMLFLSFFLAHLPGCVLNVIEARQKQNLPVAPVFLEWIPIISYCLATAAWVGSPHSVILEENHLVLWCLTQSFVFGRMTTKIILAHLTRQAFPYWTVLMTPLVGGAVLFNLLPSTGILMLRPAAERLFLWSYFVFAAVIYGRWAILVTSSICDYLGIECLTIPKEKQRANEEARRAGKLK
jgi:ethanolaminephosphotransferase